QAQNIVLGSTSTTDQLNYSVAFTTANGGNWLFVGPLSGSTLAGSNTLTVSVLPGILSPGTYTGTITITATGPGGAAVADSPITIPVVFQVTSGTMSVSPTALTFTQTANGAAPPTQKIDISSNGPTLTYTAVANVNTTSGGVNWLSVTPSTGTTPSS